MVPINYSCFLLLLKKLKYDFVITLVIIALLGWQVTSELLYNKRTLPWFPYSSQVGNCYGQGKIIYHSIIGAAITIKREYKYSSTSAMDENNFHFSLYSFRLDFFVTVPFSVGSVTCRQLLNTQGKPS